MFSLLSLYSKPTGIPTYAQNFPYLSPYLPQETNRSVAPVPLAESLSSGYTTDRPAAPSFGMITDLPLPVPTTETLSQVCIDSVPYKANCSFPKGYNSNITI